MNKIRKHNSYNLGDLINADKISQKSLFGVLYRFKVNDKYPESRRNHC